MSFQKNIFIQKLKLIFFHDIITRQKKITIRFLFETGLKACELFTVNYINDQYIRVLVKGNKIRDVLHNNEKTFRYLNLSLEENWKIYSNYL